jgi:hypothetical protein
MDGWMDGGRADIETCKKLEWRRARNWMKKAKDYGGCRHLNDVPFISESAGGRRVARYMFTLF